MAFVAREPNEIERLHIESARKAERVGIPMIGSDLWQIAREAMTANGARDVRLELLRLAKEGHRNAVPIVAGLLADVTGCPCGDDDLCEPSIDTPGRAREREALKALHDAIASTRKIPSLDA